ncbi:hypothetical protein AB6A23_18125 [Paenibacillus tarimensis]
MPENEKKDRSADNNELNEETMDFGDTCRDMTLVTDGKQLEDGIVEIADDKEYVDEP